MIRLQESKKSIKPFVGKRYKVYSWKITGWDRTGDSQNSPQVRTDFIGIVEIKKVREMVHLNPIRFVCDTTAIDSFDESRMNFAICPLDIVKG